MVVRLMFLVFFFAAFTATQANPLYPYGPYPYGYPYRPYPIPYGNAPMAAYPYGVPLLRNYDVAGIQSPLPGYYNVPGAGMMQRNLHNFLTYMRIINGARTDVVQPNEYHNSRRRTTGHADPNFAVYQETRAEGGGSPREGQNSRASISINRRSHNEVTVKGDNTNLKVRDVKEITGNKLELAEEYEQNRERDTEWNQSDYDNADWEDTNDIDVYDDLPKKSIDLKGDTYVNDLLAAKGVAINPDAEFIPPRERNNEREKFGYEDLDIQSKRRLHYHGDTRVNDVLAARNIPINPDAEFIPPSSKYSTPIEVHYGYEIDDEDNNRAIDLTHDIDVNNILAAKGVPINPDAETIDFGYKENNDNRPFSRNEGEYSGDTYVNTILKKQGAPVNPDSEIVEFLNKDSKSKSKQRGQYTGDTYVNELLAERGAAMNPDAEIFTPEEEMIEFVPLEIEESDFEHDLRGDIQVNKIAERRGVPKNPEAEEFDPKTARYRNRQ